MADVLASTALKKACTLPFDEGRLWKGSDSDLLRSQLQGHFQPAEMLRQLKLERNEVIALVNLLSKLSHSVAAYRQLSGRLRHSAGIEPCFDLDDFLT